MGGMTFVSRIMIIIIFIVSDMALQIHDCS